jgi:hypothetical protein
MARKTTAEKSYGLLRFYLLTRKLISVRTVAQQYTKTISQCTELYSVHTRNKSLEYWTRISHYRVWLHIVVLPPARRTIIQNHKLLSLFQARKYKSFYSNNILVLTKYSIFDTLIWLYSYKAKPSSRFREM